MKDLFDIIPARGEGVFDVRLNPDHAVFQGHFPGNAVLPGVCSMMIVRECASSLVARPLQYVHVKESKFLAAITPDAHLTVAIRLSTNADTGDVYTLDATIRCGEITMLKLKARLEPDE
ncbi:MAG: hydroxymyristoyl-ACP dehydratase [Alistipes sp.]|jgi:3-hydroxyacyl-[acyl-carrier-protein] dehydratase|nr:hydroxymyristoyl-ACP dehydratase [Alistipes sp.]